MIRATTPTHVFTFPTGIQPSNLEKIEIVYSQCGEKILEKSKSDLTFTATSASLSLTQEELNKFKEGTAEIQVRAKNDIDKVMASQILNVKVRRVLSEEVL